MPAIQPPTGPIEISDPNNVPELFVNGPFNVMNVGGMVLPYPHGSTTKAQRSFQSAQRLSFKLR